MTDWYVLVKVAAWLRVRPWDLAACPAERIDRVVAAMQETQ